jgi:hypothetical protein
MSNAGNELAEVSAILAKHWDPLGTIARGGFEDEYDSYVPHIARLARRARTLTLARHLVWLEQEVMLLDAKRKRAVSVAKLLVDRVAAS